MPIYIVTIYIFAEKDYCQNTEELCKFISQYDCNDNLVKRKCPKTCDTCNKG